MSKTYLTNEGSYSNSKMELRFMGNNNIIQMINRSEKKDKAGFNEPRSVDDNSTPVIGQTIIKENPFSSLYEKPYQVPFSQRNPQLLERHETPNIHNLITTTPRAYPSPQIYTDGIDVAPQGVNGFTDSYGPTPADLDRTMELPYETPIAVPIKDKTFHSIVESSPVKAPSKKDFPNVDKFYPVKDDKFKLDDISDPQPPVEEQIKLNKKNEDKQNKMWVDIGTVRRGPTERIALLDDSGEPIRFLNMNRNEDIAIYERFFKRKYPKGEIKKAIEYIKKGRFTDKDEVAKEGKGNGDEF